MIDHELKLFLSVAEHLHFGKASQAVNLSASALTRSIQRLEDELGQKLFIRDNRTVQITEAGIVFRKYAKQAVDDLQAVREDLEDQRIIYGDLSIYSSLTAAYSVLPELITKFGSDFSDVKIALRTGAEDEAIEKVLEGEIDIAVAALPDKKMRSIEFLPLLVTDLVFVGAKSLTLPSSSSLVDTQLILPEKGVSRVRVDKWLSKSEKPARSIMEVSGNEAILAMVSLGCGVGVVPELVLEKSPFARELEILDPGAGLEPYTVGLCSTKKNLEKASVAAFWKTARVVSGIC